MKLDDSLQNGLHDGRPASAAPAHPEEFDRLASVCGLTVFEQGFDPTLDEVARQAAALCSAPYGLVTLVREHEQVFLGRAGIDGRLTPRDEAICAHTILQDETFVVDDLLLDARFAGLPIATRPPFVRFYAGAPIRDRRGLPLGSLCVLDTKPHALESRRLLTLMRLAALAGVVLETRRLVVEMLGPRPHASQIDAALARLDGVLAPLPSAFNGLREA